jgi:acyl-CoA synthetase (AMP-forming)/AMP-acid ligase II
LRETGKLMGLSIDDAAFTPMPIGHAAALGFGVGAPLVFGGSTVLLDEWDPRVAWETIDRYGCTNTTAGPPFLRAMSDTAAAQGRHCSTLRVWLCGSAPIPEALVDDARRQFGGCRILTNFGQSETYSVANLSLDDPPEKASQSDGRAQRGTDMKVVRLDGSTAGVGEIGEIVYRGPGLMLGYWRDPERTAQAIDADGWCHSGDLGHVDGDGYLCVTGRKKDVINRGGENISALEVELSLLQHPFVEQVAVVGVPDRTLGERICAFVVPVPGQEVNLESLRSHLRDVSGLAAFKWPEQLQLVGDLPTTALGKVKKQELRDEMIRGDPLG